MKKYLLLLLSAGIILIGCATTIVKPTIVDTEIIKAPFDKVWAAVVETVAEKSYPIDLAEKSSGLITTKFVKFADGLYADKKIDEIAVRPSVFMSTWKSGRYLFNIFVKSISQKETSVKITSHIEGFENNINKDWIECYSKGVIEENLFKTIKSKITVN